MTTVKVALALNPSAALLCKLGSIIVHIEEMYSDDGQAYDKAALDQLLSDPEIVEWRNAMDSMAMLPRKRKA